LWVNLWKNGKGTRILVHQIVAEAFLGPRPKGFDTHHVDGNKQNNKATNLKYITRQQHVNKGSKHCRSKLTEKEVKIIRKLYKPGSKYIQNKGLEALAVRFNVSRDTIYKAAKYITYK
jgi:predicted transcriptional regulator YheO